MNGFAYDGIIIGNSRNAGMSAVMIAEKLKLHKVTNLSVRKWKICPLIYGRKHVSIQTKHKKK
jgi:hypothetical protein